MIEIIAMTPEDARRIQAGGAGRIELVSALTEGGLTPSYGLIEAVTAAVDIPVNVMIRPHGKHFVYTDEEIKLMKKDIQVARELGANGVVFGVLTPQNQIDIPKLEALLAVCDGLEVTFHRAIDETDHLESIRILRSYPQITTVLTSGGLAKPIGENLGLLKEVVSERGHIDILLGSGLNNTNFRDYQKVAGTLSCHFGTAVRDGDEITIEKVRQLTL